MDIEHAVYFEIQVENSAVQLDVEQPLMLQVAQLLPRLEAHENIMVRLPGYPEAAALLLQLLLDKAALITVVCMKSRKTAIGVEYIFKECIVLTGNKEY
jgi:hypothetical protein